MSSFLAIALLPFAMMITSHAAQCVPSWRDVKGGSVDWTNAVQAGNNGGSSNRGVPVYICRAKSLDQNGNYYRPGLTVFVGAYPICYAVSKNDDFVSSDQANVYAADSMAGFQLLVCEPSSGATEGSCSLSWRRGSRTENGPSPVDPVKNNFVVAGQPVWASIYMCRSCNGPYDGCYAGSVSYDGANQSWAYCQSAGESTTGTGFGVSEFEILSCTPEIPQSMPYYPPKLGYCLSGGINLDIGPSCMTVDQAKKACSMYYDKDAGPICAGFWYYSSACDTSAWSARSGKTWSDDDCWVSDWSVTYNISDDDCKSLCLADDKGVTFQSGSGPYTRYCSAVDFVYTKYGNQCRLRYCPQPVSAPTVPYTGDVIQGSQSFYLLGDERGYMMNFNSQFNLEKEGTGDCKGPSFSKGLTSTGGARFATPAAVKAVYHFAGQSQLPSDEGQPSTNFDYASAAQQCFNDASCQGYTWSCPDSNCFCQASQPNCAAKFPVSTSFTYSKEGSSKVGDSNSQNVFYRSDPPEDDTDAAVTSQASHSLSTSMLV